MRYSEDHERVMCSGADDCRSSYPNHKFGGIRAHGNGWFISKADKKAFCPNHIPEWVPYWRALKAGEITMKEYQWRMDEIAAKDIIVGEVAETGAPLTPGAREEVHWYGPNGEAPCKPVTGWDGPLHPQRKYVTCRYCRAAAYPAGDIPDALAEAQPAVTWMGQHPPGARLPARLAEGTDDLRAAYVASNTALQIVVDAFASLELTVEVTQEKGRDSYFVVAVLDQEGTEILQLNVEDMRQEET